MLVVIAENLPDAVRGKMKLWFIEPKPNVFVSSVADALARKVVLQLLESCTPESGMLIVESRMKSPGYVLWEKTLTPAIETVTGFQMIRKKKALSPELPEFSRKLVVKVSKAPAGQQIFPQGLCFSRKTSL